MSAAYHISLKMKGVSESLTFKLCQLTWWLWPYKACLCTSSVDLPKLEKAVLVYREHGGEGQVGKLNHDSHSCHPMRTFLFGTYPSHTYASQIRKLGVEEEGIKWGAIFSYRLHVFGSLRAHTLCFLSEAEAVILCLSKQWGEFLLHLAPWQPSHYSALQAVLAPQLSIILFKEQRLENQQL